MNALVSVLAVAFASVSYLQVPIAPKFTSGEVSTYSLNMSFDLMGNRADLKSKVKQTVAGATKEETNLTLEWIEPEILVDGSPQSIPFNGLKVKMDGKTIIRSLEGGLEGSDGVRTYLCGHFFVPSGSVEKDKAVVTKIEKDAKTELDELTVETTFLGEEEVSGEKTLKFKQKVVESKTGFTIENTVWATGEGKVRKVDGKFKELPVPAVGSSVDGTLKMEYLK